MSGPVITAHPIQLTFAAACADVYAEENDAADGVPRRGVAYLIRTDRAVTAASVVAECLVGQVVWLRFSGGLRAATLIYCDEEADCALLALRPAVISQLALTLRRGLCQPGDACQTWASGPTLRSAGQVVQALVHEPLGEDELRGPALLLRMVAGSERLHKGLIGSPIFHDGYVVGHLRTICNQGGQTMLLACPAPYVEALALPPSATQPPQPPRASYAVPWYVPRPAEEARAHGCLQAPSRPLLIFAPEGHGKTWFLHRLLDDVREQNSLAVSINLERLPPAAKLSLPAFLLELDHQLRRQLAELPEGVVRAAADPQALLELVLDHYAPRRLYLALDRLDMLRDTMYQDGLVGLLADWAERGSYHAAWRGLRLILTSTASPDWLVSPHATQPLSVLAQELPDLSAEKLLALARLHQLTPTEQELADLQALVGGQPYLSRVAMYTAAVRGESLGEVLRSRPAVPTPFDPFLEACQRRIAAQPGVWPTLERILRGQTLEALDRLMLPRLERMGIVRRTAHQDPQLEYTLRYPLYRRLLEI